MESWLTAATATAAVSTISHHRSSPDSMETGGWRFCDLGHMAFASPAIVVAAGESRQAGRVTDDNSAATPHGRGRRRAYIRQIRMPRRKTLVNLAIGLCGNPSGVANSLDIRRARRAHAVSPTVLWQELPECGTPENIELKTWFKSTWQSGDGFDELPDDHASAQTCYEGHGRLKTCRLSCR